MWRVLGLGLGGDKAAAARLLASAPQLSGFQTTDRVPWTWLARRLELPDPTVTAP
jgi:hypothetical protein